MPQPSARVSSISPAGKDGWEVHFEAMSRKEAGDDVIMLSVGDHDFDTPTETVEAGVAALRGGYHHYTQLAGIPALRSAMARISTLSTGIPTSAENVLATIGGQAALSTAAQGCLDPGDHAVVVAPYYATYPGVFRAANAAFTVVDTHAGNGFQPLASEIEAAVQPNTRLILINSPNNPTGAIYTGECLEGIAAICRRHDLWLLSDEVYWSFASPERPHLSPRALPDMAERTLVINSMSKSHGMTGWRVGWLTGPRDMIATLVHLNLVGTYGLIDFVSRAAVEALDGDYGLTEIAARYARRRTRFLEAVHGMNGVIVRGSEGGMYVMLDIAAVEKDDEKFAWAFLNEEKVAVMPGSSFGAAAAGHIRISLTQPADTLAEAARRLRRFVAGHADRSYTI